MGGRIVVFGATGYTGRLVAERLAGAGERPVLAGRSPERLEALAADLGGLETAHGDVLRTNSVFSLVDEGDVLVTTVGPFLKWGEPAVRAAITARAAYIDSTGEPAFIRRVFQNHGPTAAQAGVPLLTAMGYDFVPGALAGALALEEAGEAAVRVDVGYYALGMTAASGSAGTRASMVGATLNDAFAYRDGKLRTVRSAERVRSFTVKDKERAAVSVGGAEHLGLRPLPAAARGQRLHRLVQRPGAAAAGERAGRLVRDPRSPVCARRWSSPARSSSRSPTAPRPAPPARACRGSPRRPTTPAASRWPRCTCRAPTGTRSPPTSSPGRRARALAGRIKGTGALGPVEAFGLAELERACAAAGLTRVAA